MSDNPFADRAEVTINMNDLDEYLMEKSIEVKEYNLFEVDLLFFYINEITGTFVEFEVDDVPPQSSYLEAIQIFMQRVRNLGNIDAKPLPKELLHLLPNEEIDLFFIAGLNDSAYREIQSRLFVQKRDEYYYDKYGFRYIVAAVGITDATLWYEQQDATLLKLHIHPEQLEEPGVKLQLKSVEGF